MPIPFALISLTREQTAITVLYGLRWLSFVLALLLRLFQRVLGEIQPVRKVKGPRTLRGKCAPALAQTFVPGPARICKALRMRLPQCCGWPSRPLRIAPAACVAAGASPSSESRGSLPCTCSAQWIVMESLCPRKKLKSTCTMHDSEDISNLPFSHDLLLYVFTTHAYSFCLWMTL